MHCENNTNIMQEIINREKVKANPVKVLSLYNSLKQGDKKRIAEATSTTYMTVYRNFTQVALKYDLNMLQLAIQYHNENSIKPLSIEDLR